MKSYEEKLRQCKNRQFYLILDNKENETIEFGFWIWEDKSVLWDTELDNEEIKRYTAPLYTWKLSDLTERELFQKVENSPEKYSYNSEKADLVKLFISQTYIYALDSKFDKLLDTHPNKIKAIDNYFIDHKWKKLRPTICNMSARTAVAYLRRMWVPAVEIVWDSRMWMGWYDWHAWVRYYDDIYT